VPTISGIHHVALTVSDLAVSAAWYGELFGMQVVMDEPHTGGTATILRDPGSGLFLGLHQHDANDGGAFHETTTGLDHLSFGVPDQQALEAWRDRLQQREISQSPITDRNYGSVLVFRDPDNIQLELIAPPVPTSGHEEPR